MTEPISTANAFGPMGGPKKPQSKLKRGGTAGAVAAILAGVYAVEGGYVNDPLDRGGATNYGITENEARLAGYRGDMAKFPKHCLGTPDQCADKIYLTKYIEQPGFMRVIEMEPAVGAEMVDTGVNMGPAWPSRWFEQYINMTVGLNLPVDGKIKQADLQGYAIMQMRYGVTNACRMMLDYLDDQQLKRYQLIVQRNPSQQKFYKGWVRWRINNVDRNDCGPGE